MRNTRSGFLSIAITIFIALLVMGGVAYFYKTRKSEPSGLSEADFKAAVSSNVENTKVIARGDINQDGFADAIVEEMSCGASCSFSLHVVFNLNNNSAKLLPSPTEGYDTFAPAYYGSGAAKSEVTSASIKDGIISLSGMGLGCTNPDTDKVCSEEEWHVAKTVNYKFDGEKIVQQ